MEEYLAFIDEIGRSIDGNYTYCFYFTYDKEIVWGEYFNICPTSIIPNLTPDNNTLSHKININFPQKLNLAKNNTCFSMQDCIDGILPLAFVDIYDNDKPLLYKNKPLFFPFGEDKNIIIEKCNTLNLLVGEIEEILNNNDEEIDNIINNINNSDDFDDDYDF